MMQDDILDKLVAGNELLGFDENDKNENNTHEFIM